MAVVGVFHSFSGGMQSAVQTREGSGRHQIWSMGQRLEPAGIEHFSYNCQLVPVQLVGLHLYDIAFCPQNRAIASIGCSAMFYIGTRYILFQCLKLIFFLKEHDRSITQKMLNENTNFIFLHSCF